MVRRSGPSDSMRPCTDFCAPVPRDTMVIIAPTPMMMPSIVSAERSRLERMAWMATRMISPKNIASYLCGGGVSPLWFCCMPGIPPPPVMRWMRSRICCWDAISDALGSTSTVSVSANPSMTSI